ncbi:MAG: SprT-like domain-containing protein [Fimbriimonas ginsengisoli]|uniref:SprT-like domain-containing protein n=1 Tax=Fimbriimonas ginsengisoli TaxID=1005039 RepID=A0A931LVF5_FIMGI|nr:SprT-like domain-containing protein [Fimbriimonas ginsengisoli]
MTDLPALAERLLTDLCERHPIGIVPRLVWKRLRVTAGLAYYRQGAIALSSILIDSLERLETTLRHEYAHLMAYRRAGRRGFGHGEAWRAAMRELGEEPKVRHAYEVVRNNARQEVAYDCQRCGAILTRRRILPKRRKYVHAACGGALRLRHVRRLTD